MLPNKISKIITLSSFGGGLEMYDFVIYLFFQASIGKLFFSNIDKDIRIFFVLATFAIGYLARPIGAVIFSHIADRYGRRPGLLYTLLIMIFSSTLIAIMPGYNTIGLLAPIALIILRILQGISVGGDLTIANVFVYEHSSINKRGLSCGLVFLGVNIGILIANLICLLLIQVVPEQYSDFLSFRIAFLIAAVFSLGAYFLRRSLVETEIFTELKQKKQLTEVPIMGLFKNNFPNLLIAFGFSWFFSVIVVQLFLYSPHYLHTVTQLTKEQILYLNLIGIVALCVMIPIAGYLSDRIKSKYLLGCSIVLIIILTFPAYYGMSWQDDPKIIWFSLIAIDFLSGLIIGIVPAVLASIFKPNYRSNGVSISYNFAFAIFGGLTPIIVTSLIKYTHLPRVSPGFNLIVAGVIALIAWFFWRPNLHKTCEQNKA